MQENIDEVKKQGWADKAALKILDRLHGESGFDLESIPSDPSPLTGTFTRSPRMIEVR